TEAVTVAMTDRAEHRFLKLRNRVLKHDNDKDLLKLEHATGELKTILSLSAAPDDRRQSQVRLLGDIESNIRLWRQAHTRLPLLKLLSATPEIDARVSLADDLAEIRLEQQLIARKRKDRVRRLLIGPNSE
ncbi:MAG: hypothetical protein L7S57_10765, partial [Luminiphilus sp.]|nr:hypothetical protein [Luminiphilus sp.]